MDFSEFLTPVGYELRSKIYQPFVVGNKIRFDWDEELNQDAVVLIGLTDLQSENFNIEIEESIDLIRKNFYNLSISNWRTNLYDLGTIQRGNTFEDSCFALHQVVSELVKTGANIIVLGGSQAFNYILYKSLQRDLVKVGTVDYTFDIQADAEELNAANHITKMILDETHRLLEFKNIASQAPYISKEEMDILEQLNFEDLRLGKTIENLSWTEPMLRELHLLSVDLGVMQQASFSGAINSSVNGLNAREICGIMNYAGLSETLKLVHFSNFLNCNGTNANLLAEMLWYFIEAKNNLKSDQGVETYRVQSEEGEVVFLRSKNSDRWWVQAKVEDRYVKIPCNESDYLETMNGEIPNKWLKIYKKFY